MTNTNGYRGPDSEPIVPSKGKQAIPPKRRKFVATFYVEMEVDQALIDAVLTDAWRAQFYPLHTPEDVASHLAYNFMRGADLSSLDGFADQPEERAKMGPIDSGDCDEVKPKPAPRKR